MFALVPIGIVVILIASVQWEKYQKRKRKRDYEESLLRLWDVIHREDGKD